jgi:general secretion pathway protein A
VLTLGGGKQPTYYALLDALDRRTATVVVAGATRRVARADISPAWSGDYVLLWQPPPGGRNQLAAGSSGPAIAWLRRRLGDAGSDSAAGPDSFDDDLRQRVKAFQTAEGIIPDGIAGALTLVRLNLRLDKDLPRLSVDDDSQSHVIHP